MNSIKKLLSGIGLLLVAVICYLLANSLNSSITTILFFLSFIIGVVFLISGIFTPD